MKYSVKSPLPYLFFFFWLLIICMSAKHEYITIMAIMFPNTKNYCSAIIAYVLATKIFYSLSFSYSGKSIQLKLHIFMGVIFGVRLCY